jgi:hypothetical protein
MGNESFGYKAHIGLEEPGRVDADRRSGSGNSLTCFAPCNQPVNSKDPPAGCPIPGDRNHRLEPGYFWQGALTDGMTGGIVQGTPGVGGRVDSRSRRVCARGDLLGLPPIPAIAGCKLALKI